MSYICKNNIDFQKMEINYKDYRDNIWKYSKNECKKADIYNNKRYKETINKIKKVETLLHGLSNNNIIIPKPPNPCNYEIYLRHKKNNELKPALTQSMATIYLHEKGLILNQDYEAYQAIEYANKLKDDKNPLSEKDDITYSTDHVLELKDNNNTTILNVTKNIDKIENDTDSDTDTPIKKTVIHNDKNNIKIKLSDRFKSSYKKKSKKKKNNFQPQPLPLHPNFSPNYHTKVLNKKKELIPLPGLPILFKSTVPPPTLLNAPPPTAPPASFLYPPTHYVNNKSNDLYPEL